MEGALIICRVALMHCIREADVHLSVQKERGFGHKRGHCKLPIVGLRERCTHCSHVVNRTIEIRYETPSLEGCATLNEIRNAHTFLAKATENKRPNIPIRKKRFVNGSIHTEGGVAKFVV